MQSQAQRLISLFRTIVLAGVTALLIASAALPMPAQSSVPATASQAARMPQFAARLAHPATPRMPRRHLPPGNGNYDNGPVNGQVDAWTLNFGFVTTNSIQLSAGVTGLNFWAWLLPGDTMSDVQVSIGSSPFAFDQFNGVVTLTQSDCFTNDFGYDVCMESANITNGPTLNGNAWVTLQNANVSNGDPAFWDENSGVGCQSPGCPSQAEENMVGTVPSETFTVLGNGQATCFESGGNLQIIHNFTQQQAGTGGQDGVVIDNAGNLYGAFANGGDNSAGFAFKLTHLGGWLLDPLYSFFGGNSGGEPTGVILGTNGSLYGGAQGGMQNCGSDGSQYCGLVFNLRPQPSACRTALCSWTENVPYRFSSDSDGSGTIHVSASDQQGNLYGTTSTGGAFAAGTVFELTPSGGSWTKTILYSFTGHNDGSTPTQVLLGNDGNLYGVAAGGAFNGGVVFQLTPSGGQWTQSVVHAFGSEGDIRPGYLVRDSAGNLYGIAIVPSTLHDVIFVLLKTSSGWGFNQYMVLGNEFGGLNNLAIDAAGNLYGTGSDGSMFAGSGRNTSPGGEMTHDSFIFKASYAGGWQYENLEYLSSTYLDSSGTLALDTSGNLYGTTGDCGTNNSGTVWQFSP